MYRKIIYNKFRFYLIRFSKSSLFITNIFRLVEEKIVPPLSPKQ